MRLAFLSLLMASTLVWSQDPKSADPKQRVKAAKAMGKDGAPGIEKLKPFLSDVDASVRRAAVESLVSIGGQATLEP